jgi:ribose transport system permease protein
MREEGTVLNITKWITNPTLAPLFILVGLAMILAALDPRVLSPGNLTTIIIVAAPIALIGLAAMIALVSGGIDLSAGMGVTFCCIVTATVFTASASLPLALLSGMLTAVTIGATNGVLVGVLRIPPFVATLATMVALQGLTLYFAQSGVLIVKDPILRVVGQGTAFGLPFIAVFAGAAAFGCGLIMRHTGFGLRIYAVGSDSTALQLAGIGTARQLIGTYIFAGGFVFLCSVALIGRVPIVTPTMGGTSLLLDGLSAAVLGGVSMFGGRGTVIGLVCGAITVSLITTATQIFGLDPSAIGLVKGSIVLVALGIDRGISWLSQALNRSSAVVVG